MPDWQFTYWLKTLLFWIGCGTVGYWIGWGCAALVYGWLDRKRDREYLKAWGIHA